MPGGVNRAHAAYMEKYQKGEETWKDYVNLRLGRDLGRREKVERESKVAQRQRSELGKVGERLQPCALAVNQDRLRSIAVGQAGPIVSSNPAAVEYLGGNDELALQMSIAVTRFRENGVVRHCAAAQEPNQVITQIQANAVISGLRYRDHAGIHAVPLNNGANETMQSLAEKVNNAVGGLFCAQVVRTTQGMALTIRRRDDQEQGPRGFFVRYDLDADEQRESSWGTDGLNGDGTLYSVSLLGSRQLLSTSHREITRVG